MPRAARRPSWLAPEKENSENARQGFLWGFEEGRSNECIVDELDVGCEGEDNGLAEASKSSISDTYKVLGMKKRSECDVSPEAQSSSSQGRSLETGVKSEDNGLMKASKSKADGKDEVLEMKKGSEDNALADAQGSPSQEKPTLEPSQGGLNASLTIFRTHPKSMKRFYPLQ